ncbi:O-antigen ligase family protein [Aerococcus urinaeequi]|uniref:O-antigen ligase family protein n=1 Tax=Aerococcus urinaeequi TaxID=51665 RepID=UPI003D6B26AA
MEKQFDQLNKGTNKLSIGNLLLILVSYSIIGYYIIALLVPQYELLWTVSVIALEICLILFVRKSIIIDNNVILWFLFVLLSLLGIVFTRNITGQKLIFLLSLIFMLLTYNIASTSGPMVKIIYQGIRIISIFLATGSILQLVNLNLLMTINSAVMPSETYNEFLNWVSSNRLVGYFSQSGTNGFVLSVLISTMVVSFYDSRKFSKKVIIIIGMVIVLYFLFLTGKRGFIFYNIINILILAPFFIKNKYTVPIVVTFFVGIFSYILFNSAIGTDVLMRFDVFDVSSGRFQLNELMIKDIVEKPIFGWGTYTTFEDLNLKLDGHNIYLQVFRENGLFGFVVLIVFIIMNFIKNLKLLFISRFGSKELGFLIFSLYNQLLFVFWGLTGNPLYDGYPLLIYFISIIICEYIQRLYKNDIEEGKI